MLKHVVSDAAEDEHALPLLLINRDRHGVVSNVAQLLRDGNVLDTYPRLLVQEGDRLVPANIVIAAANDQ